MLREEQLLWSWICDNLDTIQDEANTYDLAGDVADLLDRTRHEQVSVWQWKELLDELAEQVSWATDYASLGDRPVGPGTAGRRAPVVRQVDTGFGCPGGLCDRLTTGGLLDPTPVCRILAKDMTLRA